MWVHKTMMSQYIWTAVVDCLMRYPMDHCSWTLNIIVLRAIARKSGTRLNVTLDCLIHDPSRLIMNKLVSTRKGNLEFCSQISHANDKFSKRVQLAIGCSIMVMFELYKWVQQIISYKKLRCYNTTLII